MTGKEVKAEIMGKGVMRAGEETYRAGEGTIRAGQNF